MNTDQLVARTGWVRQWSQEIEDCADTDLTARADGDLSLEERGVILEHARRVGAEALVAQELQTLRPLAEIVGGVTEPKLKADLYTLAFTLVRADENVTGAERIYLAQLAHQLGLDAAAAARLENEAAAHIDAEAGKAP